jgi:hypothetical protein
MSDQNSVIYLDPDALVRIPDDVFLTGVRHDQIDGHNTIALGDLARHVVDMADARDHLARIAEHPAAAYAEPDPAPAPLDDATRIAVADALDAAAADVFDTAMPAYVARWLEARAAVTRLGGDVTDPDVMDMAVAEMTARARIAAEKRATT